MPILAACAACGKAVRVKPSRLKGKVFHCSTACRIKTYSGENHPNHVNRIERICAVCGITFYRLPGDLAQPQRTGEFCSATCWNAVRGERRRGTKYSEDSRARMSAARRGVPKLGNRKPDTELVCLQCSQKFVIPGRLTKYVARRQFCSRDCRYAYLREHPEVHGRWKGGRVPYYGPNWNQQRKLTRKRDNYTCQHCGFYQVKPAHDVHHIRPFRTFGLERYKEANELSNLVTLCHSCHMRVPQEVAR